jgi:hypothetical protein
MDEDELQDQAARDQLWASLRALLPMIELLAAEGLKGQLHEPQLAQLLARVVLTELRCRSREGEVG